MKTTQTEEAEDMMNPPVTQTDSIDSTGATVIVPSPTSPSPTVERATPRRVKPEEIDTRQARVSREQKELKEQQRELTSQEIQQAGTKLQQENRLPPKPGDKVTDSVLQEWLNLLTPPMWDKLMIYVNRAYPIINRKMLDPDAYKYVDVITKEALETNGGTIREYLKRTQGGGRYVMYVNDTSRSTGQNMFEAWATIPMDEAEPKLILEEVEFYNARNAGYVAFLQNKGVLDANKKIIPTNRGNVGSNNSSNSTVGGASDLAAMGQLFTQMANTFKSLNPQDKERVTKETGITEILLEKLKQEDPNKQMTMVTTLVTALQAMLPKPDTSNTLGLKDIMQMMNDSHNKQMEMMKLMFQQSQQKQNSEDTGEKESDLDKLIKWKTALPELFGKGRGSSGEDREKSTTEIVIEAVKDMGLPVLGLVSQFIQLRTGVAPIIPTNEAQARAMANMGGQGQGNQPMQPGYAQAQPQAQYQTQPQLQQLQGNANPNPNLQNPNLPNVVTMPAPTPTTEQAQSDPDILFLHALLNQYGMMIINALKSGQTGIDVGEYVKGIAPMVGQDIHAIIAAKGEDKLLLAMKTLPEFWIQTGNVYGEKRIQVFVNEFVNFEQLLAEMEDDEDGIEKGKETV